MMAERWPNEHVNPGASGSREFLVNVEVYISNASGTNLRKPAAVKGKKGDKRDSGGDDGRFKEKSGSNWPLSLQRHITSAGHWRSATCKLTEDGERCMLNVYVDDSILYQTIYIHLLNQTDIRPADTSLFYRKDCVGIFAVGGQRWNSSNAQEPLYLQFPNSDVSCTWQALLKSYAIPEIYGRWWFPLEGGSYRMWRQVELTILQGRNLGSTKHDLNAQGHDNEDGMDADIACEVHLNGILCSRTTVKKGPSPPDWHESFTFSGLPPFEHLEVVVWRDKKPGKPTILGTTRIALGNFRRGDDVEGWFPILQPATIGAEMQMGDLRLKIRVDEEIILPYSSYNNLLSTCNSRNFLDWMADLEGRLKIKSISSHLMSIAIARNVVVEQIQAYAAREVENSTASHQTLFRGNTTLTKVIELFMTWYGRSFLEASIGTVLRRLCHEKIAIEVDPVRGGKHIKEKEVERNVEQLIYWCQEFWKQIYSVRAECPNEMRILFKTIRKLVEQKYKPDPTSTDTNNFLPWQSVSAFCFLRFIVPAILHPHLFGLYPGLPNQPVQRSLTLIAKVIQSLANLNTTLQKETFMRGVQDFLKESLPTMIDYIAIVSTPISEAPTSHLADEKTRHDRLHVVNALRHRTRNMNVLDREAVPILPHLLDIPRHLAVITSAVIRSSRDLGARPRAGESVDAYLDEFCARCYEVEEEALNRVSQLASKVSAEGRRPSLTNGSKTRGLRPQRSIGEMPKSPLSPVTSSVVSAGPSRQTKGPRPSTAPSPSETSPAHRFPFPTDTSIPGSKVLSKKSPTDDPRMRVPQNQRHLHIKAPSTDSVPSTAVPTVPIRLPSASEQEPPEDPGKKKKGLLRMLRR